MSAELTAVSLFSGCGGFDWGASRAGVDILWANDIHPVAASGYRSILPDVEFHEGDVAEINTFPEADVLIGCYPCTGFSLGSRRRWRDRSDRSLMDVDSNFLYKEFLRALKQVRPKYLLVENVRGMLTAEGGAFFRYQLEGFKEAGFKVYHSLLDARDYGVAQSRARVFIAGIRKDLRAKFEFPAPSHGQGCQLPHRTLQDAIGGMESWPDGEYCDYAYHGHYLTRNRKRSWGQASYTIVANERHVPLHPMGEAMEFIAKDQWRLVGEDNRRLSWRECGAIQGLPAQLAPDGRLIELYRVVGNAVPPQFGEALTRQLVAIDA